MRAAGEKQFRDRVRERERVLVFGNQSTHSVLGSVGKGCLPGLDLRADGESKPPLLLLPSFIPHPEDVLSLWGPTFLETERVARGHSRHLYAEPQPQLLTPCGPMSTAMDKHTGGN